MVGTDRATSGLARIVTSDSNLEMVAHGLTFGEGPVWNARERAFYWVDIIGDTIWRWIPGVGQQVVMRPSGKANGMTLDGQGRLVVAGWGSRSVWRIEPDGLVRTLASEYRGVRINTPNDIVVRSDGVTYWTDPSGALFIPGMEGPDVQRYLDNHPVFRLDPDGTVTEAIADVSYPNGLCFSPDQSLLYVNDTWRAHIRAFKVAPAGELSGGEVFYSLVGDEPGVADGMKVDRDGNVYVTGPGGIQVVDPAGALLGRILVPGHTTNMAFGDDDWRTLYITTYECVYRLRLGIPGIPVGPPVVP
ncbi:MAG TPA: SMP-30/gluconolactonase/LRE family protein [Candidatus Acidoferrales bacterium]|nr:SMP-30/gluconolactonase/LRE family protein [Candidatus Acidoferrales bacterium]